MQENKSKLQPSDSVQSLTAMFINLCAINSFKMHLVGLEQDAKDKIIESMIKQWEKECQSVFDQRFLQVNEMLKTIPVSERLQASMQVDKMKDQFEVDLRATKMLVAGLL